jgi:hypothetical protein
MRAIRPLFCVIMLVLAACAGPVPVETPSPTATTSPTPTCPQGEQVLRSFYAATDAGDATRALDLLAPDATLVSWSEGINGHHMDYHEYVGKDAIAAALANPGLRHSSGKEGDPVFHEESIKLSGDTITFYLRPDRKHPDGRPYNPFQITVVFHACQIRSLTVVERVTWV